MLSRLNRRALATAILLSCLLLCETPGLHGSADPQIVAPTRTEIKIAEQMLLQAKKEFTDKLTRLPIPENDATFLCRIAAAWCDVNKAEAIKSISDIRRYVKNANYNIFPELLKVGEAGGPQVMKIVLTDFPRPSWLRGSDECPPVQPTILEIAKHSKAVTWEQIQAVLKYTSDPAFRREVELLWAETGIIREPEKAIEAIVKHIEDEEEREKFYQKTAEQLEQDEGYIPVAVKLYSKIAEYEELVSRPGEFTSKVAEGIARNMARFGRRVPEGDIAALITFADKLDAPYAQMVILDAVAHDYYYKDKKRDAATLCTALKNASPHYQQALLLRIAKSSPSILAEALKELKDAPVKGALLWEEIRHSKAATMQMAEVLFDMTIKGGNVGDLKDSRLLARIAQNKPGETFEILAGEFESEDKNRRETAAQCLLFASQSSDREAATKLLESIGENKEIMSKIFAKQPYRSILVAALHNVAPAEAGKQCYQILKEIKAGQWPATENVLYLFIAEPKMANEFIPSLGADAVATLFHKADKLARIAAFAPRARVNKELRRVALALGWLADKIMMPKDTHATREELLQKALEALLCEWMEVNPEGAIACASSLPHTNLRTPLIMGLIPLLAEIRHQKIRLARDMIIAYAATDKSIRKELFTQLLLKLSENHPNEAAGIFDKVSPPETFTQAIKTLTEGWKSRFFADQAGLVKACLRTFEATKPSTTGDLKIFASMCELLARVDPGSMEYAAQRLHKTLEKKKVMPEVPLLVPIAYYDPRYVLTLCRLEKDARKRANTCLKLAEYMLKDKPSLERIED